MCLGNQWIEILAFSLKQTGCMTNSSYTPFNITSSAHHPQKNPIPIR